MCSACKGYVEFRCDCDSRDKVSLYLDGYSEKPIFVGLDTDENDGEELTSVRFNKEKAILFANKMLELAHKLDT